MNDNNINIEELIKYIKKNNNYIFDLEENNKIYINEENKILIEKYIDNNYNYLTKKEKKLLKDETIFKIDTMLYNDYKNYLEYNNNLDLKKSYNKLLKYFASDIDFIDYDKKSNYIDGLINYCIESKDTNCIKALIEYFESESKIAKKRKKEEEHIRNYQSEIKQMETNDNLKIENLSKYFNCLREAILNYDEKEFGRDYSFHSKEIDESIHRGLNLDFSISKSELPHLLGVKNPIYDDEEIILKLYNSYLNENNMKHSPDNYLQYLYLHLEEDLKKLIEENRLSKTEMPNLKKYLIKSFEKCLTFIKVYEYKRIPEIILDYQKSKDYDITYTDHTKDLITKAEDGITIPEDERRKLTDISLDNLNRNEIHMLNIISKKFGNECEIIVKVNPDTNDVDLKWIIVDDILYHYKKNDYWANLKPDIFIVSYDKKEYEKQKQTINKYLRKAVKTLCAKLKRDLNIKDNNTKNDELNLTIEDSKRKRLINLDLIKQVILSLENKDVDEMEKDFDTIYRRKNDSKDQGEVADNNKSIEDYNNLKLYMEGMLQNGIKDVINYSFGIADLPKKQEKTPPYKETDVDDEKLQEQPHIRMIQRIMDRLMRKDKDLSYPKKDVSIIGYGTVREKESDFYKTEELMTMKPNKLLRIIKNQGKFREKFAKTLMGKTFLQLEFDLRKNGYSYKLNGISKKVNGEDIYYNYDLLIEDKKKEYLYEKLLLIYKELLNNNEKKYQK